jgi:hypothetical protein
MKETKNGSNRGIGVLVKFGNTLLTHLNSRKIKKEKSIDKQIYLWYNEVTNKGGDQK